ncbi:MAG: hypothetical protein ABSB42_00540 [Tepidisphaeraceae bacterium]|jgi:hypothetical protein
MKVKGKKKRDARDRELGLGPRRTWRLWSVTYRQQERLGDGAPVGCLLTTFGLLPLPIAFVSNVGQDAMKLAIAIVGGASFAGATDLRGRNWLGVGTCVNGAILRPLNNRGQPELMVDHLDAAMVSIDPLDGGVSWLTFDNKRLRTYLGTQSMLDWSIPRAIARQNAEAAA